MSMERGRPARPSLLRRTAWVWVLLLGVGAYLLVLRVMVATQNLNFFPSLLLIGAITVPVSVLVLAMDSGRGVRVDPLLVTLTAVVGGVVGTVTAGTLEYETLRTLGSVPMVLVGLIEEAAKLLVPLAIYLRVRPHDPRAGVVIGVASGMGFATLETMGYGFQALLSARDLAAVDQTLLLRALLSPACHIAWTGMTTAMLWRIPGARHHGRAVLAFVGTYLVAVTLHAIWDGSTRTLTHTVVAVIGLVVLVVFIHRAHHEPSARRSARPAPA